VIVHPGHLKDDQLLECYVAARGGESLDPRAAEHLADCSECDARFDDLAAFMDTLRDEADAETDALFPAERLAAQQHEILHRLEHVHRQARVISFPNTEAAPSARASARVTPRWLAAAAAAGLFVGVAVGGFFGPDRLHRATVTARQVEASQPMTVQHPVSTPAVRVGNTQPDSTDDDAFLMELEVALASPHTRELQPFDAMTPHVRDIYARER
jgi:hypothetical protein